MMNINGDIHLCRARCPECVPNYLKGRENDLKLYYIAPEYVPKELICNNYRGDPKHSGIIASEQALNIGYGVFAYGPLWKFTDDQIKAARSNPL